MNPRRLLLCGFNFYLACSYAKAAEEVDEKSGYMCTFDLKNG